MAGEPAHPLPTLSDAEAIYRAAPAHMTAEILHGVVMMSPRPRSQHARVLGRVVSRLDGPFDLATSGPGGWVILPEPELHLGPGPDRVVPDVAGWLRTRMSEVPDVAAFTLPPDWVCEILSPSTEAIDRGVKVPVYERESVPFAWLIDPDTRTLEVLRREGARFRLVNTFRGNDTVRAAPFDAVELDLALLWAR